MVGVLCVPFYTLVLVKASILIGGFLIGAVGIGLWGVIPAYLAERFPTAVRGAGPGSAYHVGAAIGSFAPTVVALGAATPPGGESAFTRLPRELCSGRRTAIVGAFPQQRGSGG